MVSADTAKTLDMALKEAKEKKELTFIEIKCSIGAREDLGRPITSPMENKSSFMDYLNTL